MKKYLFLGIFALVVAVGIGSVAAAPNGQPFQALWDTVADLQQQILDIELTPGPQGPQGEMGDEGNSGSIVIGYVSNLPLFSISGSGAEIPNVIPGSELCVTKLEDESLIRISYLDSINVASGCKFKPSIDGNYLYPSEISPPSGNFYKLPLNLQWVESGVLSGEHCIDISVYNTNYSKCETGYSSYSEGVNNHILVEELNL